MWCGRRIFSFSRPSRGRRGGNATIPDSKTVTRADVYAKRRHIARVNRLIRRAVAFAVWACLGLSVAVPIQAQVWAPVSRISNTIGNNAGRVCVGGGADFVGCPSQSLYVTSGGQVGIGTNTPSATLDVHGTVSATYLQLSSPTAVLACSSTAIGAMRYTSGTMQVCDGSNWGNIGIGVPTGTIAAFAAASCPNGWSEYTPARGRFLRGIDNGAGNDPDGTRAAGNAQADAAPNITGSTTHMMIGATGTNSGVFNKSYTTTGVASNGSVRYYATLTFDASESNSKYGAANEIRPKNVAVTFCVYSGFQSTPATVITQLSSLTDVSVAGATAGQSLIFDGASWIASNTVGGSTAEGDRIVSGSTSIIASEDRSLTFTTAGTLQMVIGEDGNVGIGTDSPRQSLHVVNTASSGGNAAGMRLEKRHSTPPAAGATSTFGLRFDVENSDSNVVLAAGIYGGHEDSTAGAETGILRLYTGSAGSLSQRGVITNRGLEVTGTISATDAIQVGTSSLTCAAGLEGAMRYTSGTMQVCDGSEWGNIGIGVPTGTIVAFASANCPNGWTPYTPAQGRFLRGIDPAGSNDTANRSPGNVQQDALQNITGRIQFASNRTNVASTPGVGAFQGVAGSETGLVANNTGTDRPANIDFDASRVARTADETRPKNVAVRFCMYAGFESAVATGITTIGGLSDVSIGGATDGQVLTYSGGTWVASDTAAAVSALNDLSDVDTSGATAGSVIRYDGANWVVSTTGDSTAEGDRITSGTLAMVANSATSYISLSTAGTTWGYLSSLFSYLPNLSTNTVSATGVLVKGVYAAKGLFTKDDAESVAFIKTGNGTVSVKAGTVVEVNNTLINFQSATPVSMPALAAGTDYAIYACGDGTAVADGNLSSTSNCTGGSRKIGGFHYAPGGNATGTSGGNTTPQINEYSFWDVKWRPACKDPRGMTLVNDSFWVDIYLTGVDHHVNGTSKYNVTIADGSSPPKIPAAFGGNGTTTYATFMWYEANEVMQSHGKELLSQGEFAAMAQGTTEASSGGTDPVSTILREAYTSKYGVMLSTGNLWVWGRDFSTRVDGTTTTWAWKTIPGGKGNAYTQGTYGLVAALLGGAWSNAANSGSRASFWSGYPWASGSNIGARGRCDHVRLE